MCLGDAIKKTAFGKSNSTGHYHLLTSHPTYSHIQKCPPKKLPEKSAKELVQLYVKNGIFFEKWRKIPPPQIMGWSMGKCQLPSPPGGKQHNSKKLSSLTFFSSFPVKKMGKKTRFCDCQLWLGEKKICMDVQTFQSLGVWKHFWQNIQTCLRVCVSNANT